MSTKDTLGIIIDDTNEQGLITRGSWTVAVPTTANKFAAGCILIGADGAVYSNAGTSASPSFQNMNDITTSEIAAGAVTYAKIQNISATDRLLGRKTTAAGVVEEITVGGDITQSGSTFTIGSGAVSLTKLASAVAPSHVAKYSGKITWSGSGASLATTVTGVASTDIVIASIQTVPSEAGYILSVAPTTNTITIVLSTANTSNDAVIAYTVLRATS